MVYVYKQTYFFFLKVLYTTEASIKNLALKKIGPA
jgi:hypothetical protein